MANLRQNDVGATVALTLTEDGVVVDISTATTKQIKMVKPSGEVVTRTGSFVTNGSNGQLYCTVASDDLDEVGVYKVSMYLVLGSWTGHSSRASFIVDPAP